MHVVTSRLGLMFVVSAYCPYGTLSNRVVCGSRLSPNSHVTQNSKEVFGVVNYRIKFERVYTRKPGVYAHSSSITNIHPHPHLTSLLSHPRMVSNRPPPMFSQKPRRPSFPQASCRCRFRTRCHRDIDGLVYRLLLPDSIRHRGRRRCLLRICRNNRRRFVVVRAGCWLYSGGSR